ncbi:MAG: hypothetical protein ABSF61_01550 [Anaerolineales bacterium]
MSVQTIRVVIAGALLLHGIAHAIGLGALLAQSLRGLSTSWVAVRSWLFPTLSTNTAATAAVPFWIVPTIGFIASSASFWGILVPSGWWRQLALAGSIASILGIALFSGSWPGSPNSERSILNTSIALIMNIVILVAQLWLHWPSEVLFGK